jgi:hypothetical protein
METDIFYTKYQKQSSIKCLKIKPMYDMKSCGDKRRPNYCFTFSPPTTNYMPQTKFSNQIYYLIGSLVLAWRFNGSDLAFSTAASFSKAALAAASSAAAFFAAASSSAAFLAATASAIAFCSSSNSSLATSLLD